MSSSRPKVNPPLCPDCRSSAEVQQDKKGQWYCMKSKCISHRFHVGNLKPIMISEVEPSEPVSIGLMNRLWAFLTRDIEDDRRPKHPRPELHAGFFGGLRSPKDTGAPRPKPPQPKPIDVGRPPRGGSGALPAPPPDCPTCEVGRVERIHHAQEEQGKTFIIERFHCVACSKVFTMEDVAKAKGMKKGPPKIPDPADDPEPRIEEDYGATMRAYREERRRSGGVPMCPDDSDAEEKKDHNQLPTEKSWRKPKSEKAPEASSAWWTATKWIIGVGASIGLGWFAEWAFF